MKVSSWQLLVIAVFSLPSPAFGNAPATFLLKWGRNGGDGTSGSAAGQFFYPDGIAVSRDGFVYVADQHNHRIQKFDGAGTFLLEWGAGGTGNGQFQYPRGIAVDDSGNVYVADRFNHRLQKFRSDGTFVLKWGKNGGDGSSGSGDGDFTFPSGVALDRDGNVYVTDSRSNYRVQKFTRSGAFLAKWGEPPGPSDISFYAPEGVAVDRDGHVFVVDASYHRVQKFDLNGTFLGKWGKNGGNTDPGSGVGEFSGPEGLAVDPVGNVLVADTQNHRIQKFNGGGSYVTRWGEFGTGDGQLFAPGAVAVDGQGHVYVADTNNHRIQKFGLRTVPGAPAWVMAVMALGLAIAGGWLTLRKDRVPQL